MNIGRSAIVSRGLITALAALLFVAAPPREVAAQSDPLIGTWKLNLAKSTFRPGLAPRSAIVRYEPIEQGLRATTDIVDPQGKKGTGVFTIIYDGQPHPVTGVPDADSSIYKRIDANTAEYTRMKAGRTVQSGVRTVSNDGRTMTFTRKRISAQEEKVIDVYVYEKQ
jgi:hypothetical protein